MKRAKKILAVLLSLLMALSILQLPAVYAADDAGQSLSPSKWAAEDVGMAQLHGLAGNEMFEDYLDGITRQELYKEGVLLYEKLSGKSSTASETNPFKDTKDQQILKAYALGLIKAVDGSFEPSKKVKREEAGLLLYNVIKLSAPELDLTADATAAHKDIAALKGDLQEAVKYLFSKHIFRGGPNSLALAVDCTRQEMIVLVQRTYDFVMRESGKASKGIFYKVSGGKSPVYILGSIHMADISLYPMAKEIEDEFEQADYLAVEANVNPSNDDLLYLQQKTVYSEQETLDKNISAETYKLLAEKMQEYNIPAEMYNRFKPWYAALLIPNLSAAQASINGGLGVDMYFLSRTAGKQLLELEGIKFQVDLFDNFSLELQEQYLLGTLEAAKSDGESEGADVEAIKTMLSAWKDGKSEDLEKMLAASDEELSPEMKEFNQKFWDERNINMAEKIKGYLEDGTGKTYFAVFGAGHLYGATGVLKALKESGYTVEQILK